MTWYRQANSLSFKTAGLSRPFEINPHLQASSPNQEVRQSFYQSADSANRLNLQGQRCWLGKSSLLKNPPSFAEKLKTEAALLQEAKAYEELALQGDAPERRAYLDQALFYYQGLTQPQAALRVLKSIHRLLLEESKAHEAISIQAQIYLLEGQWEPAIQAYQKLEKIMESEETLEAEVQKEALEQIRADLSRAYQGLASQQHQEKLYSEAVISLERAFYAFPHPILAEQLLSYLRFQGETDLKRFDESIRQTQLEITALKNPDHSQNFLGITPSTNFTETGKIKNDLLAFHQGKLESLEQERAFAELKIQEIIEAAYPQWHPISRLEKLAAAYVQAGDPDTAAGLYHQILASDGAKQDFELRHRSVAALATLSLESSLSYQTKKIPTIKQARYWLEEIYRAELHDATRGQPQLTSAALQNRLLAAELAIASQDFLSAELILRGVLTAGEKIPAQNALQRELNQAAYRLASLWQHDLNPERRNYFYRYLDKVLESPQASLDLKAASLWEKSVALLQDGKTKEHLSLRRDLEEKFPETPWAALSREAAGLRDVQGRLDLNSKKNHWLEAEAVLMDRGVRGMGNETLAFIGLGVLSAVFFEVSLAYGIGAGLAYGMGYQGAKHSGEVREAFRYGISNVDSRRNFFNHFGLASQFLLKIPSGWSAVLVEKIAERGLSRLALLSAQKLQGKALSEFEIETLTLLGKGVYVAAPNYLGHASSMIVYQAGSSLLFQEGFRLTPQDVLQLCFFRAVAAQLKTDFNLEKKLGGSKFSPQDLKVLAWTGSHLGAIALVKGSNHFMGWNLYDDLFQNFAQLGGIAVGRYAFRKFKVTSLDQAVQRLDEATQRDLARVQKSLAIPSPWRG